MSTLSFLLVLAMDVECKEEVGTQMRSKAKRGMLPMQQSDLCEMEESYRLQCTDGTVSESYKYHHSLESHVV